jgi:hypothetical protein
MSDRDIKSFDARLADQVKERWSNYERIRLDLTTARNYYLYDIAGEFLSVERVSSNLAAAEIRLDYPNRDEINFGRGRIVETLFKRFFVSNAVLSGEWMDLIIGRNFKTMKTGQSRLREAQQVLNITNVAANTNTVCAAGAVQAAHIKADVNNTGIVWIDFGVAAVQNSCIPLDPGEWVIMPISNTSRINANFVIANEIAYVTPII